MPLVQRAQTLWQTLSDSGETPVFHRSGVINLGPRPSLFIQNAASGVKRYQLPCELMTGAAVNALWSVLRVPEDYIGVFEPQAGYLKSELAIARYISLAEKAGCAQLFNCGVTDINLADGVVQVKTREGSRYQGRKLLVAAGTWVKQLLPSLPITPVRKVFSWHQADGRFSEDNHFPAFTVEAPDDNHYYGFPALENALKVGKHTGGQRITAPEQRKPFGSLAEDGTEVFGFLSTFLPGVGVCLNGQSYIYDLFPDEDFIIDTLPEHDNVLVISGLSGHGFKFASVLGERSRFRFNAVFAAPLCRRLITSRRR